MAFMELQTENGSYYLVDTPDNGTQLIPMDVVGIQADPADFRDYVDSASDPDDWEITDHVGWFGRYSAPGYMDCTDWSWADTEEELIAQLKDLYGDDDDDDDDDEEGDEEGDGAGTPCTYRVVVGDVGTAYEGSSLAEADDTYEDYLEQSRIPGSRACGEPVTLLRTTDGDQEVIREDHGGSDPTDTPSTNPDGWELID